MPRKKFPSNEARTRRRRPAYPIPTTPEPITTRCVILRVPNDLGHLAALSGAVRELTKWNNWQLDVGHNATKCASLWAKLLEQYPIEWSECPMPALQFRQPNNCTLEASFDGGETWSVLFDAYQCGRDAARDEIQQEQVDGSLGGGGQPPAQGGGSPTTCYTYHITLQANQTWKIPFVLTAGDTIQTTNVSGGWTDLAGVPAGNWYCPNGDQYLLGACIVGAREMLETDPLPTAYHMRLIGQFGSEYADMYNTSYTVPSGSDIEGYIQANDSAISDNAGSIQLDIQICKGGWCKKYNFALGDGSWVADGAGTYGSVWETTVGTTWIECYIKRSASAFSLTHVEYSGHSEWSGDAAGKGRFGIYVTHGGTTTKVTDVEVPSGDYRIVWDGSYDDVTDVWLDANVYNHQSYSGTGSATITEAILAGHNSNPFGSNDC